MHRPTSLLDQHRAPWPVCFVACLLAAAGSGSAAAQPQALAPGDPAELAADVSPCPVLRWQSTTSAGEIELVVYEIGEIEHGTPQLTAVYRARVPAASREHRLPATSCLAPGRRHAWSVRELPAGTAAPDPTWAEPLLFRTAAGLRTRGATALRALSADAVGVRGEETSTQGLTYGIYGSTASTSFGAAGVRGETLAASGATAGLVGRVASPQGFAGAFVATGNGRIISGRVNGFESFYVSAGGVMVAQAFVGGARSLSSYSDLACATPCVGGNEIESGVIGPNPLATGAVTAPKIVDGAVTTSRIADGAVTTPKIDPQAVTNPKLATNAVRAEDLAPGAVLAENFATGAVTRADLEDQAVTNAKFQGTEVPVYRRLPGCTNPGHITSAATCQTTTCDFNANWFFDCAAENCQQNPLTCNNSLIGRLLAPEIP